MIVKILIKTIAIASIMILLLLMAGCGSPVPERLIGAWDCGDTSSGVPVDTSFYSLDISDDGTFSLNNEKTGEPDLSGTMEGDDTGKIGIIQLECDKDSFSPPECWPNLHTDSRVRYKTVGEDTLKLGYVGIWMTFTK